MTESTDRQQTLDELYAQIKTHGWEIDVRGFQPTLRRKNTGWARTFQTQEAAIMFALQDIRDRADES